MYCTHVLYAYVLFTHVLYINIHIQIKFKHTYYLHTYTIHVLYLNVRTLYIHMYYYIYTHILLYTGTTKEAIEGILTQGFRLPNHDNGMYGKGVYFASDSSKSAQKIYTKGRNCNLFTITLYHIEIRSELQYFHYYIISHFIIIY